jgi:hypothetical protein
VRRSSRGQPDQQRTREEPEPDEQQPGGPWWRAARSTASASHADSAAAANANQKWLGWSPTLLTADGTASSSHRSASGNARWNTQITKRARLPRRTGRRCPRDGRLVHDRPARRMRPVEVEHAHRAAAGDELAVLPHGAQGLGHRLP